MTERRPLTDAEARALTVIQQQGKVIDRPSDFAYYMWPDSRGWTRAAKCGYGTSKGGGMRTAAGGYLGKLRKRGLITSWPGGRSGMTVYKLTEEGSQLLSAYVSDHGGVVIEG